MSEREKVQVAVIGAGFISRYHLTAMREVENIEVRIVCDADSERAHNQARKYGVDEVTTNAGEVFSRNDIDAVLILTPNHTHRDLSIRACEAGKHVLVQKPFARTVKEAQDMMSAAERTGRLLVPSFMHRFMEETAMARDLIESGMIGRLLGAHIRNGVPGPLHAKWFFDSSLTGGGAVIDIGVHGIDLLRYLVGEPVEVTALVTTGCTERKLTDGSRVVATAEDLGSVAYRMESGIIASQDISWCQYKGSDRFSAEIYGDQGTIVLRQGLDRIAYASAKSSPSGAWIYPVLPNRPFGYNQHKAFADAILGQCDYPIGPHDGLVTIRITEAIYRSVLERKAIGIER